MQRTAHVLAFLALFGLASAPPARAAPVSAERAVALAGDWSGQAPLGRHGPHRRVPTGRVRTFSENGADLFHLVALEEGGFVALAADDARPPVMAFSASGELPAEDDGGPLWTLLAGDAAASAGRAPRRGRGAPRPRLSMREAVGTGVARRPFFAAASSGTTPKTTLSDVRVAPLVESRWNQLGSGTNRLYNYYTPSNWYCGCVATAMAQVMRYHRFPTDAVTPRTFTCYLGTTDNPVQLTMKGGTYDWGSMPFRPIPPTPVQQEAIGRLCYDAGVSVRMVYASNGSGALLQFAHDPLVSVFGYADAQSFVIGENETCPSAADIQNAILANLDAGCPVMLGIFAPGSNGRDAGHAIVADGYGYDGGTLWCHLNLGWGGSHDLWYALPSIPAGSYSFSVVDTIVYNIFPHRAGELVTGRVTTPDGAPIEGATVSATGTRTWTTRSGFFGRPRTHTESIATNVLTSAAGIYALYVPTGGTCSVTLTAAYGAAASATTVTTSTSTDSSPYDMDWETGSYFYDDAGLSIGNSWGNDLVVVPAAGGDALVGSFSAATENGAAGFSLSFTGTPGAGYAVEYRESLSEGAWTPCTNLLLRPSGSATLFLPCGDADSGFWRVVPAD